MRQQNLSEGFLVGMAILNKNLKSFSIVAVFLAVFLFIYNISLNPSSQNIGYVKIAGQNIRVDLALTEAEQARGLSGREGLNSNEGMLFIFPKTSEDQIHKFWMKDMNFPIDMIWISRDMRVVYIKKDARPESYPDVFGGDQGAKYVLEVVSGFADENNLKVGDIMELTR